MFQPNSVIAGRYQVIRLVGQGGMSNLYLAYDRKYSNAVVVVKEMTASYSDPKEQQMAVDLFHREAQLLASLNHRHIPKVYDYFQFAGKYYLSMEFIDGVDLAVKLDEEKGPLEEKQVLEWGEQMATVLFYLHKHDPPIVFRDVKPSNIMISSNGIKLIDFGIARHFDHAKKGDTMRIGSPGYAPPEQYAAQTDPRSDIYALGVTLHHALTGRDPTTTSTPFIVPPARTLNPKLSESTAAMLARATQLDPSDRYQSALDMKKDIRQILKQDKQSTRVVGAAPIAPPAALVTPAPANGSSSVSPPAGAPSVGATPDPDAAGTTPAPAPATAPTPATATVNTTAPTPISGSLNPDAPPLTQPGQSSQPVAIGAKKKVSSKSLLLAACLFMLLLAGAGIAALPAEKRQIILDQVKTKAQFFIDELTASDDPEMLLRESLISGKPETLLPLFESSEFQQLSPEKQELFRLNLLAAGSAEGNLRVISVLVPEEQELRHFWKAASALLGAVNGVGGLNRELYVIVPTPYKAGSLALTLKKLTAQETPNVSQNFVVLGRESENLPEELPAKTFFLGPSEETSENSIRTFGSTDVPYRDLFQLSLDSDSPPTVWALPTAPPAGAVKSTLPYEQLSDPDKVNELLQQANSKGGRVLMLASTAALLSKSKEKGILYLLATTPDALPQLSKTMEAQASVLSSPFESAPLDAVHLRPAQPTTLDLEEGRIFDALLLSALPKTTKFEGLTLSRDGNGRYQTKAPIHYKWNGKNWLPKSNGTGTTQ